MDRIQSVLERIEKVCREIQNDVRIVRDFIDLISKIRRRLAGNNKPPS